MVSKFGDYYDHIKDWTIGFMIVYILYPKKQDISFYFCFHIFLKYSYRLPTVVKNIII
jgi:hypothetical protein